MSQILGQCHELQILVQVPIKACIFSFHDHEVADLIPGNSTNFKCGLGLERGPPSLEWAIG